MEILVDITHNRLVIDDYAVNGRLRWEAICLSLLLQGQHVDAGSSCGAAKLQERLAERGQRCPLNRKQLSRLFDSLAQMFQDAGRASEFLARFGHAARTRTVGPWWWLQLPQDVVQFAFDQEESHSQPLLPGLSIFGDAISSAALCRQLLICHGKIADADHGAALMALNDTGTWKAATPELEALRMLRIAESCIAQRDFVQGRLAMRQIQTTMATSGLARNYFGSAVQLLELRLSYAQAPTKNYASIATALRPLLGQTANHSNPELDGFNRSAAFNLAILCERRWLEQHAQSASHAEIARHMTQALRYGCAALFGYLVGFQYEYVQYICANLAYFLQRSYVLGLNTDVSTAFTWYALAQAWQNRFELPDNTVWEYVFLGDFWLYHPEVRPIFLKLTASSGWEGRRPDTYEFYFHAWNRACEIAEPRQMAHTALNLYHFALQHFMHAELCAANTHLQQVLQKNPDVLTILLAEGYAVPARVNHNEKNLISRTMDVC